MCNLLLLTCVKLEKVEGETKAEGVGAQKRAQAIAAARMVSSLCVQREHATRTRGHVSLKGTYNTVCFARTLSVPRQQRFFFLHTLAAR